MQTRELGGKVRIDQSGMTVIRLPGHRPRQFQVLGERASGTNILRKLIEVNLPLDRVDSLGWKHGFPHMVAIPPDLLVLCVVRHAWDWVTSLYTRPWHAHPALQAMSFAQFIRSEWHSIVDRPGDFEELHPELNALGAPLQFDRHPITGLPFANVFALRNAKIAALRGMAHRNCNLVLLRSEDFLADPEAGIGRIADAFDLPRPQEFRNIGRRLGTRFRPSVEGRAPAPEFPDPSDAAFMLRALDLEQEAALGYSYT